MVRFFNIEKVSVELQFSPLHHKLSDSNGGLLALDDDGGLAIIPPGSSSNEDYAKTFGNNVWRLLAGDPLPLLFIGVCPPREFDWDSSFSHIVHYSSHIERYPTDEQIIAYSQYAKVLEMHSWVWENRYDKEARDEKGEKIPLWRDYSSRPQDFRWVPDDETELKRVIATAHAHGMKIIPYVNFSWKDSSVSVLESSTPMNEVFKTQMAELQRLKDTYNFDGLYLDGLFSWDLQNPKLNYEAVRSLRELFGGDGWLTYHNTRPDGYFFPFINAYMDLIITSEHRSFDRWKSTSYRISNAIASVWPEIPMDIKEGREFLRELVDNSLLYNNRVVLMTGKEGQWRSWRLYFSENEMNFMQQYYFNELQTIQRVGYKKFILDDLP